MKSMSPLWTEIGTWWLRLALAGGLLLLAGWVLVAACRAPALRLRAGSWTVGIALLLLPLTLLPGWFALPWSLAVQERPVANHSPTSPTLEPQSPKLLRPEPTLLELPWLAAIDDMPEVAEEPPAPVASAVRSTPALNSVTVEKRQAARPVLAWIVNGLLLGYGLIVLTLLGRLAWGQWQLVRLWRSGRPAPLRVRQVFYRQTRRFRIKPALRIADGVLGPICFGVYRPRIVLPAALADSADETSLRWIFGHELSHLERRDPLVGWLMGLAQSLFFVWPWLWKLRRLVRLNQEYLADAAAVQATNLENDRTSPASAADYAEFLVRLTSTGVLPAGAAGVKTPASDLFRRVTMLLNGSGNVDGRCPRRWSLIVGGGLLALGITLAGIHVTTRNVAAADETKGDKAEPPKKETIEDVEDQVRKALEALKKGPDPRKEEPAAKPPAANKADDEFRKAEEALNKARKALNDNPGSDDNRKAFQDAMRKYQEAFRLRMQQNAPELPRIATPFPALPIDPNNGDINQINEQLQRMMEMMQKQMQLQMDPLQPGFNPRLRVGGGLGGLRRLPGELRLGVRIEKPQAALVEQLDLPANKGIVVTEVQPDSVAAKAGVKANDILLEIGGKPVPSDVLDLQDLMRGFKADEKVDITLLRKGKKETLKGVELPEAKADRPNNPRFQFPNVPFPNVPNLRNPNAFPPEAFQGPGNTRSSITINNGELTLRHEEDGVKVNIVGNRDDGNIKATSIEIEDNGKTIKADSIEKLDKQYQPLVEKLLKRIR
jgi:beta-lactamase regulating signal transducer with metallopeptidase domain